MSLLDFEWPQKDLDQLEDRLRSHLRALPDARRRDYYDAINPRLRDPDTFVVLCWSLSLLGLHHLYLGRWLSFIRDLIAGACVVGILIFWMLNGEWSHAALLFVIAVAVTVFDTIYSLALSQRIVQKYNIMLGLSWLNQNGHPLEKNHPQELLPSAEHRAITQTDRKLGMFLAAGTSLFAGVIGLLYFILIPMLSEWVATALPENTILISTESEAANALDQMKTFTTSELPAREQERLRTLFHAIPPNGEKQAKYFLFLRKGNKLGANAFAFPRGQVVLTDELVQLTQNDQELIAVMAHELGHLHYRHGVKTFVQNSTLLALTAWITGDMTSIVGAAGIMMNLALNANYSRQFEREADDHALNHLQNARIPVRHFVDFLQRLKKTRKSNASEESFLSSHPPTEERIQHLVRGSGTPI
ncbi:MAG: M48 family metallopeptidase [Magnetococcales bacterium]|nr:M48 family metallopeptidase [Magnetococcales bacterium]